VRRPEALSGRTAPQTEIVHGDVLEPSTLHQALAGVTTAYYLVHSMAAAGPFADADRRGAENFAAAAREGGVSRIVYLGGLGAEHDLSEHLESRHEVGRILRESGVPTIEFRASVVIGSGSASFEIVRSLVDRTPAADTTLGYVVAATDRDRGRPLLPSRRARDRTRGLCPRGVPDPPTRISRGDPTGARKRGP
jgi:uncharacterized protein YbjT (DUF2867 family)